MPYRIERYLPPGRGDIPAFTLAEAGTRFDPGRCKAELTYLAGYTPAGRRLPIPVLTGPDVG